MEHKTEVLRRTIEEQNGKITMYQTKLRDLVVAYKDLQKEKSALEASINALSLKPSPNSSTHKYAASLRSQQVRASTAESSHVGDESSGTEENTDETSKNAHASEGKESGENREQDDELSSLREQLATLTQSLATVSQQRSKLEANYVAEKKKLKQDLEDRDGQIEEMKIQHEKQIQQLTSELDTLRSKVRNQQHSHDKEADDYALMLKELQQLVSNERLAKEHLEGQLEDSQATMIEKELKLVRQAEEFQLAIRELKSEMSKLQNQQKDQQKQSLEPSAEVVRLQKQLVETKEGAQKAIQIEQQRAADAEERYKILSQSSELRIAELENRLSELSDMLGGAERLRASDQQTVQRLRERVSQLDQENSALTQIANNSNSRKDSAEDLDLPVIIERLQQLTAQFHLANTQSDKPVNLIEMLNASSPFADDIHGKCKEQYEHLRDDYEKYKLRAQAALRNSKSPSSKDSNCSEKELTTMKSTISDLREKLSTLRANNEELTNRLRDKEEGFMQAITTLKESHKSVVAAMETGHRQKLSDMEMEMRKHRERTVTLLAEKDNELSALRLQFLPRSMSDNPSTISPTALPSTQAPSLYETLPPEAAGAASASELNGESASAVQELLSRHGSDSSTANLLHFAQERGRLDVELASLRKQKRDLESALRDSQHMLLMRASEWAEQRERLLETIDKESRDKSREGANLEYLKNVVYRYMICTEASGRHQIAKAIATILEFSSAERREVMSSLNKGWWPTTKL